MVYIQISVQIGVSLLPMFGNLSALSIRAPGRGIHTASTHVGVEFGPLAFNRCRSVRGVDPYV